MRRRLTIAGSLVGSMWWEVASALRRVLSDTEYDIEIDQTTHGHLNVRAVGGGDCDIGVTMPPFVDWAMRRRGLLSDANVKKLCVLAAVNQSMWLVAAVDRDAGFRTLRELGEARYPWKPVMFPKEELLNAYGERVLELHGLSREAIRAWGGDDPPPFRRLSESEARERGTLVQADYARQLASEDRVDGLFIYVSLTSPWGRDVASLRRLRFLELDDDVLAAVVADLGGQHLRLPARLLPGVDEDMRTIGWRHQYIYGREGTEPDLVRAILSALERPEFLDNAQGISYTAVAPDLIPGVELHPAAAEWYRQGRRRRDTAMAMD